jgi:hypothetical protein
LAAFFFGDGLVVVVFFAAFFAAFLAAMSKLLIVRRPLESDTCLANAERRNKSLMHKVDCASDELLRSSCIVIASIDSRTSSMITRW